MTKNLIRLLFISILVTFNSLVYPAEIEGVWREHPSADVLLNSAQGSLETALCSERYVYLISRGRIGYMRSHSETKKFPHISDELLFPFRFDKENPQEGVCPLASLLPLGGHALSAWNFHPRTELLALAYRNGIIDLISEEGEVRHVETSGARGTDLRNHVRSITFNSDGSKAYCATDFGYFIIDILTGEASAMTDLHAATDFVAPIGGKLLICATPVGDDRTQRPSGSGALFITTPGEPLVLTSGNRLQPSVTGESPLFCTDGIPVGAAFAAPLTETTLLIAGVSGKDRTAAAVLTLDDSGEFRIAQIAEGKLSRPAEEMFHTSPLSGYVTPSRTGFMMTDLNQLTFIASGIEPDLPSESGVDDFKREAVTSMKRGADNAAKVYSHDARDFYFWRGKEGMERRSLSDSGEWSAPEPLPRHNAPGGEGFYFATHPQLGMLTRGRSYLINNYLTPQSGEFGYYHKLMHDNLSACKEGRWSRIMVDNLYRTESLNAPRGIITDPENPRFLYGCQYAVGIHRIDLEHPDLDHTLFLSSTKNNFASNLKGFVDLGWSPTPWNYRFPFAPAQFDNHGTLWTVSTNYSKETDAHQQLYYWTKEDRAALNEILTDPATAASHATVLAAYQEHPMRKLEIKLPDYYKGEELYVLPLRAKANENVVVTLRPDGVEQGQGVLMIDHNGTLDDESDDRYFSLYYAYYEDTKQDLSAYVRSHGFCEIPERESIWVFLDNEIAEANPSRLMSGERSMRRVQFKGQYAATASCSTFYGLEPDTFGRKWMWTDSSGIFVIDSDNETTLAHLTAANSPLASDRIFAVKCDPGDGSMWIGTEEGIQQFFPEGTSGASSMRPSAFPTAVTPDYNGFITFHGLSDSEEYLLTDREGRSMAVNPERGTAQIHPRSLTTGSYHLVKLSAPEERLLEIIVTR